MNDQPTYSRLDEDWDAFTGTGMEFAKMLTDDKVLSQNEMGLGVSIYDDWPCFNGEGGRKKRKKKATTPKRKRVGKKVNNASKYRAMIMRYLQLYNRGSTKVELEAMYRTFVSSLACPANKAKNMRIIGPDNLRQLVKKFVDSKK